ncbi:MAG: hypothetical protein H7Z75_23185 [Ferruginibacter sp.]|nr:hypothetical protein [Cytophagales bacterium]
MASPNQGYDPQEIENLKEECRQAGQSYVVNENEPQGDEFAHVHFVGKHEGREVIFDTVVYTLRLHHSSLVYEMAEDKTAEKFPHYVRWEPKEDENGELVPPEEADEEIELFKAETIAELEDSEAVKVKEEVQLETDFEYGISLDACLNVEEITHEVIDKFIREFNAGTLKLDDTLYSFAHDEDYDEEEDEKG